MEVRESSGKMALAASQYGVERDYWRDKLSGNLVKSSFPVEHNRTAAEEPSKIPALEAIQVEFGKDLISQLEKISKGSDYTLHMVLAAGLTALLGKYTGGRDIIIGVPIYRQETEGKLLNTVLALRNQIDDAMSFKGLLLQVRQAIVEANENQNYPIETLLYQLNMTMSQHNFPLFDAAVLLENIHDKEYIKHTHPNMIFSFLRAPDHIGGSLEYNPQLYHKATAERIAGHFIRLLEAGLDNLDRAISGIDLLSAKEREELLIGFNDTFTPYPRHKTIDDLFGEQAAGVPDRVAVTGRRGCLTYKTLNEMAHRLAALLRRQGVGEDDVVAILAERSEAMVVGVLAVLKAGAAYLPIDPDYPEERKKYLAGDSRVGIMLSDCIGTCDYVPQLIDLNDSVTYLETVDFEKRHGACSLAYIIYTSGSTGDSKGVMVEHRSVIRLVRNTNYTDFQSGDRLLQTGALEFDASTFEIWGSLLNGLGLYLFAKETILMPETLKKTIRKHRISLAWMTSALFNQVLDADIEIFAGLRVLLVGGDVLSPAHIDRLKERYPRLNVINGYGPTENTTFSITHLIRRVYRESIPIGRPIANSTAYIVDRNDCLVPVGVPGELQVGGDGVARGYLNNPELTNKSFCRVQGRFFQKEPLAAGGMLYKTGDLCRWLPGGTIEFLGRLDNQVKLRGYRIEPGEIENCLTGIEFVDEAVVIVKENKEGEKYLCAYIVSGTEIDPWEIRDILLKRLPDYMVPSYFVQIDKIPLTPNGKVDRGILPEPKGREAGGDYIAPRDDVEKKLVWLWSEVLGVEEAIIGIDADFFQLGGHSLKATLLIAKIHKELKVKVPLAELFRTPTTRELAQYIKGASEISHSSIEPVEEKEYYPLSSAQERLFVLQQMQETVTNYNIPEALVLEGQPDIAKLEHTFKCLIGRHESFRTCFRVVEEQAVQQVHRDVPFKIVHFETADGNEERKIVAGFVRVFDLSRAPLLRVGLIKTSRARYILMVDMHHIITDGTSMHIFIKEFTALYAGETLPALRIRYKDFSLWQNKSFESGAIKTQEAYWLEEFKGELPVLNLPLDYERPTIRSSIGDIVGFKIGKEQTALLRKLAEDYDATLFMIILALYNVLLSELAGQEDIIVGTPIAGRRHTDLNHIIGMFVNTLAIRNKPAAGKSFSEFLKEVREKSLQVFENQEYQFEDLVDKIMKERDSSRNPIFDTFFSWENQFDTSGRKPGVSLSESNNSFAVKNYKYRYNLVPFDLILTGREGESELFFTLEYCTKLFKKETIKRYAAYFPETLSLILENNDIKLEDINVIQDLSHVKTNIPQMDFKF